MGRQRGTTLIEMIVALAITVVLVAICARCLVLAGDTRGRAESRVARIENVLRAQHLLRQMIHELVPHAAEDAFGAPRAVLHGAADALEFEAPHPAYGPMAGLYRIRLEFHPATESRGTLTLRFEPMSDHQGATQQRDIELCADVAQPVFEYLSEAGWHDSWSRVDIPKLVRIAATDPADARACWPELLIAPRAESRHPKQEPDT